MINTKAALDITKTMFCSIIDYGNIFLSICNEGDLNDIQILQNQGLRYCHRISDPRDEHIAHLHNISYVQTVEERKKKQILTCLWRNIEKGIVNINPSKVD